MTDERNEAFGEMGIDRETEVPAENLPPGPHCVSQIPHEILYD
jgi:hypothetical protein